MVNITLNPPSVLPSFMATRVFVALLCLFSWYISTVNVPRLCLMLSWEGLKSVTVVFPDHIHIFS